MVINNFIKYPKIGSTYLHYKGGHYLVMALAKHTETDETLVIYKSIEFGSTHARPLSMWFEQINRHKKRFELYDNK